MSGATAGTWDLVCVPGRDEKDGQITEFSTATMAQMVLNFAERADLVPMDHNHQSSFVSANGQPAPALAFYGALAVVDERGIVVASAAAREVRPRPGSVAVLISRARTYEGIDRKRPGLWAFRSEVTPLGQELLANYRYVSPTFISEGTRRDGSACGYCLLAVAATNTPWQSGTVLQLERRP